MRHTSTMPVCPVCDDEVESDAHACAACEVVYHRRCRLSQTHCLTSGCKRGRALEARPLPAGDVLDTDVTALVESRFGGWRAKVVFGVIIVCAIRYGIVYGAQVSAALFGSDGAGLGPNLARDGGYVQHPSSR